MNINYIDINLISKQLLTSIVKLILFLCKYVFFFLYVQYKLNLLLDFFVIFLKINLSLNVCLIQNTRSWGT